MCFSASIITTSPYILVFLNSTYKNVPFLLWEEQKKWRPPYNYPFTCERIFVYSNIFLLSEWPNRLNYLRIDHRRRRQCRRDHFLLRLMSRHFFRRSRIREVYAIYWANWRTSWTRFHVEFHLHTSSNQMQAFTKAACWLAEPIDFVVQRGVVWIKCGATYMTNWRRRPQKVEKEPQVWQKAVWLNLQTQKTKQRERKKLIYFITFLYFCR
jgi:hypothetical protein